MNSYRMVVYPIKIDIDKIEWVAKYIDIDGCMGVGDTEEEAIKEAKENLDFTLESMKLEGLKIPEPTNPYDTNYSGKLLLRLSKSMHKRITIIAEEEGISINHLINEAISEKISVTEDRTKSTNRKQVCYKNQYKWPDYSDYYKKCMEN